MAHIVEYSCIDCGMEFVDDGRLFFYDSDLKETVEYIMLFSTVGLAEGSKIKGNVNETYCSQCNKFLMVYTINEVESEFEDVCEVVKNGIDTHFNKLNDEINHLNEIKTDESYEIEQHELYYLVKFPQFDYEYREYTTRAKPENIVKRAIKDYHKKINQKIKFKSAIYEKHLNSIYLVEYVLDEEYDVSKKINCPECGKEIHKFINMDIPCPKCGGELLLMGSSMVD